MALIRNKSYTKVCSFARATITVAGRTFSVWREATLKA